MQDAPKFSKWEEEKDLLSKELVLANYWILAHFYLGNVDTFNKTVELASSSDSFLTKQLAKFYKNLMDNPESMEMGDFSYKHCKIVAEKTRKNARIELFDPKRHEEIRTQRGENLIKNLSAEEVAKEIALGKDPLELIEEYPEDLIYMILHLKN